MQTPQPVGGGASEERGGYVIQFGLQVNWVLWRMCCTGMDERSSGRWVNSIPGKRRWSHEAWQSGKRGQVVEIHRSTMLGLGGRGRHRCPKGLLVIRVLHKVVTNSNLFSLRSITFSKPRDTTELWNWGESQRKSQAMPGNNDETLAAGPWGSRTLSQGMTLCGCLWWQRWHIHNNTHTLGTWWAHLPTLKRFNEWKTTSVVKLPSLLLCVSLDK